MAASAEEQARFNAIDEAVDAWHTNYFINCQLHEFLGWTWEEYKAFVERCELPPKRDGAM